MELKEDKTAALKHDLAAFQQVVACAPDDINSWIDLCGVAEKLKDYVEVLRAGEALVRLAPNQPQAHFVRGMGLHRLERLEEAIDSYRRTIALNKKYVDAWLNIGDCCLALNRLAEAEEAYRHSIEVSGQKVLETPADVDYGGNYWNLGLIELLKGDLKNGFAHYSARFKAIPEKKRPDFPQPLWRGEDLCGKTLLITVEQGHGDTLMMARYLPVLRAKGMRILFQVQPALMPYLKDWNGADQVLQWKKDALPSFDYHASEFDLPRYCGTTLATVPTEIPYLPLLPPDEKTQLPPSSKPRVGVVWGGNPKHANDRRRSVPLEIFEQLFRIEGVEWFSLNRDLRPGDEKLLAKLPVTNLVPQLKNFADMARFIGQFDLVISCDTASAHLAGGMGKPVWVLLPFAPDWRWMLDREDSPWYPAARLFRQKRRYDWDDVVARAGAALKEWRDKFRRF